MEFTIKECEKVLEIVKKAGKLALTEKNLGVQVTHKENDEGPLTNVDKKLNSFLLSEIQKAFPKDHLISEEALPMLKESAHTRAWFIDPIDGTNDFIKGNTEWSIMVGLAVNQKAVFGIVFQPEEDCLYFGGIGIPAQKIHKGVKTEIKTNLISDLKEAVSVQSRSHPDSKVNQLLGQFEFRESYAYGSIGLKFAHIAEGRADFYINFSGRCRSWDLCAPEAILCAAGGSVEYFAENGEPISFLYQTNKSSQYKVNIPFLASTQGVKKVLIKNISDSLMRDS